MGGGSGKVGRSGSREGSRVELSCNDGEGLGNSREAMDGLSEGEGSPGCRVHRARGGAGGRMVSASNPQRSQRHSKGDQDLCQIQEVVECRHQRKKKSGPKREKAMELGGGRQGESKAPEVDSAIEGKNVE